MSLKQEKLKKGNRLFNERKQKLNMKISETWTDLLEKQKKYAGSNKYQGLYKEIEEVLERQNAKLQKVYTLE